MKRLFFLVLIFTQFAFADAISDDLEDHFRIYLIRPERRSPQDRISVNSGVATIYYWESAAKRKPDEVICDAYEYLLLGRTTYGKGAEEAFEKYPSLQKIELSLYDFEFSTKHGEARAEILPDQKLFEYLKISVIRNSLMKKQFNRKDVKKMIADKKCGDIGKTYIDSVSLKQDYFKP